jgi:hypothetical protein
MAEPSGREYIYDLLASCHIYSTSFAHNALTMAFAEGERNIGLRLGADITEAAPDLYLTMLREHNVRSSPNPDSAGTDAERGSIDDTSGADAT